VGLGWWPLLGECSRMNADRTSITEGGDPRMVFS